MGEILRGQEVVELATGFPHLIKGAYSENASTGIDVYSLKQPLGVVGIISPFNFPAMVPMWFFPVAIAAGNAVILKPSEKDPSAALWLAQLWKEAGLPDGVFTVLQGDKLAVDGLLTSPVVQSISFVGSTPIAQYIYETASRHGKRVQALGGAKNHMLVLPDADLDLVADQAVNAGYGAAGERCMAISVVLAVEPVADELIEKITERIGAAPHRQRRGRSTGRARHGPADHRRAPRQGVVLRRHRRGGRREDRRRRPRLHRRRPRGRLLVRPDPDRRHPDHLARLPGGDLRPGALDRARRDLRRGRRPDQLGRSSATARRSSPTTAAPRAGSRTRCRSA